MKLSHITALILSLCLMYPASAQDEVVTLEEVIALSIDRNYNLMLYKNLAASASIDDKYAVGGFFPVITATASRTWNVNNQKQQLADNSIVERNGIKNNNTAAGAQVSWLLFDGTRMFATLERIAEIESQSELNFKDQVVTTIAQVIVTYYSVVREKQQLNAIREQMSVSEERVRLADRRLQVGTGAKPELLQAKVDLNAQRTLVLQQQTLITQLKDQMNAFVGMQLPPVYDVTDSIVINLDIKREDILANIENRNFNLMSFKKNVDIAALSLHERKGERYPFISFVGAYNFSKSENTVAINQFTPLSNRNQGYNYGFTFSLPIMNGFTNRRNIAQARLNVSQQQILYDQAKTIVDVGVKNAYVDYDNAKKILTVEEENIGLAKENLYITLESFKRSANTFIEVRTAQQSLADAYNRLITARYLAKVAETELLRLNGSLMKPQ